MIRWFKKHYYWIIIIVMMLETSIYGGLANNLSSIFIIPVTEDIGISRSDFSLAISMRTLVIFIATTFSGTVFNRFGAKIPIIFGLAASGIGYALLTVSESFLPIALSSSLIGLGESFIGTAAASRIVNAWFRRYQGSMLGLITACTGLGGGIFSVVLSSIIASAGWRSARLLSALFLLAAVILAVIFIFNKPDSLGLRPYGEGYVPKKKAHRNEDDHWSGFTMQQMLRKPTFYLGLLTFFLAGVSIYSAFTNIAPHLQDQGMSASDAAIQNGLMLICLALFKFICGSISDVIGPKWVCGICISFAAISLWFLTGVNTFGEATIGVILYSLSVPLLLVMVPLITYPLYGYQSHDATLGVFLAMPYLGSLIVNPVSNAIYDSCGSYTPVFRAAAVLAVVVLGLLLLLYYLTKRDQKRFMQENKHTSCD